MKYCIKCGKKIANKATFCDKCGAVQSEPKSDDYNKINIEEKKANRKAKGIASFILGLTGIVCFVISFLVAAIPLSIVCQAVGVVGIVLGSQCLNKLYGNKLGIVGFSFSIFSTAAGFVILIIMLSLIKI